MGEYRTWRRKAERKGWKTPINDAFGEDVWIRYWEQMEEYHKNPDSGRPIIPHRTGR